MTYFLIFLNTAVFGICLWKFLPRPIFLMQPRPTVYFDVDPVVNSGKKKESRNRMSF